MYTYTHTHTHTCARTHIYIHACLRVDKSSHGYGADEAEQYCDQDWHGCKYMCVFIWVGYVCMYIYIYIYIHTHTHTHTHVHLCILYAFDVCIDMHIHEFCMDESTRVKWYSDTFEKALQFLRWKSRYMHTYIRTNISFIFKQVQNTYLFGVYIHTYTYPITSKLLWRTNKYIHAYN